jgi:hypothetical protein
MQKKKIIQEKFGFSLSGVLLLLNIALPID